MENHIYSGVRSKIFGNTGSHTAYRNAYELQIDPEVFQIDIPGVKLTESARLLDENRAFALAANAIREEEKARLARELHDELAQSLTALKMDTIWVRDNAGCKPEMVAVRLNKMVEMLDHTVAATRRMASDLRPLLLDDLGLIPAIEWLACNFTQRCGVPCQVSGNEVLDLELQEPYATALFRIVQESLNNVVKHAAASQAFIALNKTDNAVKLMVQDDGCGFLTAATRKPQSMGLMGMRERVQLLGGSIFVESAPGKGTCIEVYIPFHQNENGAI